MDQISTQVTEQQSNITNNQIRLKPVQAKPQHEYSNPHTADTIGHMRRSTGARERENFMLGYFHV